MLKRILSILIVFALCLAYVPVQVFAADHEVGTAAALEALVIGDTDTIRLTASIDDPSYVLDLDSISSGSFVAIDLNGFDLNLSAIQIRYGQLSVYSTAGGGTLSVNSLMHENAAGPLTLNNDATVTVNGDFTWICDYGASLSDTATLNLNGNVTLDFISSSTDARFGFDSGTSKVVIAHPDQFHVNDPSHAPEMAYNLTNGGIPAQFEISGNDTTGIITVERTLPNGSMETYTDPLTFQASAFPQANYIVTPGGAMNTYNGSAQDLFTAGTSDQGTVWYSLDNGTTWSSTIPTATDVATIDTATYMILGDGSHANRDAAPGMTVGITTRSLTITANSANVQYNGTLQAVSGYTVNETTTLAGLVSGHTLSGITATASGTNKGSYGAVIDAASALITDASSNDVTANYTITTVTGTLTITALPITVTANSDTVLYDGTAHTVSGFELTVGDLPTGFWIDGTATITETNAGEHVNDFAGVPVIRDDSDNDVSTNFDATFNSGLLTINKRTVTLTSGTSTKTHDGTPLTNETVTVGGDGWAPGEGATYSNFASITDAGYTDNTFNYTLDAGTTAGNYTITQNYGVLTVTDLPVAAWTAEPAIAAALTYNGGDQMLMTAGTVPTGCTPLYSTDGTTWSEEIPTGHNAGEYDLYYKIQGDGVNYADSAPTGPVNTTIEKAAAAVTAKNKTVTVGEEAQVLTDADYTITGILGGDAPAAAVWAYYGDDPASPIAASDIDTTTAGTTYHIGVELETPNNNYVFTVTPGTLTVVEAGGGGGGGAAEATPNENSYDFTPEKRGIGSYTATETSWSWGERAQLPKDIADFYKVLVENSVPADYAPAVVGDKLTVNDPTGVLGEAEDNYAALPGGGSGHSISSFLASDDIWVLPAENPVLAKEYTPDEALVCEDHEPWYLANGDGQVDQSTFGNSDFYVVGVGTGDMKIDYPNLKTGDVVTNTTFNGVFVTKVQKGGNPTYDADLAKLKSDTIASFRAFELDHPEVFWLNGSIKLRVLTVTINGVQYAHIFMTLVDDGGFTMRIVEYAAAGAIEAAIQQRDAAVNAIIAQIPAGLTNRQKVVNLNKWFTLNNEYNRSADLTSIGYTPHRALKSLMGNFGINGPVCDGYSRGFKTVCDRLGIPVLLDTGVASIGAHSELHMWMRIQVDGVWYGTDCTWDDPIVKGKDGKVSGYENEKYLLVGDDTVVDGAKFGISHPHNNTPGGVTGVLFASLVMNTDAINGYTPLDFEDVRLSDWFYDYVQSAVKKGLMGGTAENIFSPLGTATRGQIVQILYNAAGQPDVDEVKVEGWYGKAATWAMNKGIVAGYSDGKFHGDDSVTREQLATILWAFDGAPEQSGELDFADADKVSAYAVQPLLWAKNKGIIGGKPGNLADPQGTATRAEIATIFSNYIQ